MFLARSLSNCLKNVFFCRNVVISKAGRLRTGTQRDKINPKPIKKHTKRARELGTTTEKDAPLTCEHETWVRNLTAQSFEHDPPPGRDDDDDVTRTPQICPPDPSHQGVMSRAHTASHRTQRNEKISQFGGELTLDSHPQHPICNACKTSKLYENVCKV